MPKPDLLIVGGSVRAAAWCAVRAGLKVAALDRYNDLDLLAVASPCFKWDGSDRQVEEVVGSLGVPWMYTGPLENRPDLIDRCAKLAPLRGNPGEVLRAVRDPIRLQAVLREAGLPTLAVREEADPPPADGTWLLKPRAGSGGRGIAVWNEHAGSHPTLREPHYFQERDGFQAPFLLAEVDGIYHRSVVGTVVDGEPLPLGFTDWLDPPLEGVSDDFTFRSLGAWCVPSWGPHHEPIVRAIVGAFEMRGPFSIDFAGTLGFGASFDNPRVVEVNPRFTAGMELLLNPFMGGWGGRRTSLPEHDHAGKCVVYAPADCRAPELPGDRRGFTAGVGLADVPAPGSVVAAGEPVCTVLGFTPPYGRPSVTARRIAEEADRILARLIPVG